MTFTRGLVLAAATTTAIALGVGPAAANDISFSYYGAQASYTDATDNLCVRAANDSGLRDYAYALIQNGSGQTVASSPFAYEGQGWRCTGNLSIPEDRLYTLVLFDCSEVVGTDCGGTSRQFYS